MEGPEDEISDGESVAHDAASEFDANEDYIVSSEDEDANVGENVSNWNTPFNETVEEFISIHQSVNNEIGISNETTPLEVLENFLTPDIVEDICGESAKYAQQKQMKDFKPFDPPELWRFLAAHLNMGIVRKSSIKEYWSTNPITRTPFFSITMSRDRYVEILRSLHFIDNLTIPANNTDKCIKLGTFLDRLIKNFKQAVQPGEFLCLDESLVPFKGRLSIKQYNPKKRARFGIKLFMLADCNTKVILDILPYQGKSTKLQSPDLVPKIGFGGAAVLTLLDPYLDCGRRIVVDNYFNSPTLARILKRRKTFILGTVQKRRKEMPQGNRMTRKLKVGEVETFSDGNILVERWSDRREVCMLNSFMPHFMVDAETPNPRNRRPKPGSVMLYNQKMGIIDESDKVIAPHASIRKTKKWYRKVAFHFIDIAVYNSLQLLNRRRQKKLSYAEFVKKLIQNILEKYPKPVIENRGRPAARNETRLQGRHFPVIMKGQHGKPNRGDCVYCRYAFGIRKQVIYRCNNETCKKRLCVGENQSCFIRYHTERVIRKYHRNREPRILGEQNESAEPSIVSSTSSAVPESQNFNYEFMENAGSQNSFLEYSEQFSYA